MFSDECVYKSSSAPHIIWLFPYYLLFWCHNGMSKLTEFC